MSEVAKLNTPVFSHAPAGYNTIQPYLIFESATEAIAWFTNVFEAKQRLCMKDDNGRISHAELQIGDSVLMMADEHPTIGAFAPSHYKGSPISLMIYVENCDASYAKAVAEGAKGIREPADQPYGDRMAGIIDPFGYKWFIGHPLNKAQHIEVTP